VRDTDEDEVKKGKNKKQEVNEEEIK
jgi:hypothetical protein